MQIEQTDIPGLLIIKNDVHEDERGFFTEKFQKEKLVALGFPADFTPVQINLVRNKQKGILRGIHAEPWDKYVCIVNGAAFAAYIDLREGESKGKVVTVELTPDRAVFVPKGVGNSYQTLEDSVSYMYAVNDHWKEGMEYVGVYPFDPSLNISWPISKEEAILSDKDKNLPNLHELTK